MFSPKCVSKFITCDEHLEFKLTIESTHNFSFVHCLPKVAIIKTKKETKTHLQINLLALMLESMTVPSALG